MRSLPVQNCDAHLLFVELPQSNYPELEFCQPGAGSEAFRERPSGTGTTSKPSVRFRPP
ncbi:hypothetical protein HPP92_002765 [Vanilla planifolia]|uniref:Uncharacterized protein n=1 Tax=Vanilla planifolia TaxID=51239 RepID=A0A835S4Z1_VANPL|nr:hypothetical protein HPP92_003165 [Vanilla planifolia]KAG0502693.1 hypothetical protein HPP92_002765 [Vanilla planifolia]